MELYLFVGERWSYFLVMLCIYSLSEGKWKCVVTASDDNYERFDL
jgi:hypothetical protein